MENINTYKRLLIYLLDSSGYISDKRKYIETFLHTSLEKTLLKCIDLFPENVQLGFSYELNRVKRVKERQKILCKYISSEKIYNEYKNQLNSDISELVQTISSSMPSNKRQNLEKNVKDVLS